MTSAVQDPLSRVFASVYFHKVEYVVLLFLLWRVSVFVKSYSLCPVRLRNTTYVAYSINEAKAYGDRKMCPS